MPAAQLGMSSSDWDNSLELEAFLEYPFKIKESVEFKSYLTGAQAYILYWDLKKSSEAQLPLKVKLHPNTPRMVDRERKEETRLAADLSITTRTARVVMMEELEQRFFTEAEVPSKALTLPACPHPSLHVQRSNPTTLTSEPPPPPVLYRRGWCKCT